jgi:hypothetical protein
MECGTPKLPQSVISLNTAASVVPLGLERWMLVIPNGTCWTWNPLERLWETSPSQDSRIGAAFGRAAK